MAQADTRPVLKGLASASFPNLLNSSVRFFANARSSALALIDMQWLSTVQFRWARPAVRRALPSRANCIPRAYTRHQSEINHKKEGRDLMKPLYSLSCPGIRRAVLTSALGLAVSFVGAIPASAQAGIFRQISQDSFTDPAAQHMTEVEPGAFAYRSTVVTAFQVARILGVAGVTVG